MKWCVNAPYKLSVMAKKEKNREGVIYSTNPDFNYQTNEELESETLAPAKQDLRVTIDAKMRAGKQVTLVSGFIGTTEDLEVLGKKLKTKCGVGGTVKDGLVILQGDFRDKVLKALVDEGYKAKRGN